MCFFFLSDDCSLNTKQELAKDVGNDVTCRCSRAQHASNNGTRADGGTQADGGTRTNGGTTDGIEECDKTEWQLELLKVSLQCDMWHRQKYFFVGGSRAQLLCTTVSYSISGGGGGGLIP